MNSWTIQAVIDWLFDEGRLIKGDNEFVHGLADRMNDCGAPLDRLQITIRTLNPLIVGTSNRWMRSTGKTERIETGHGIVDSPRYIGSPLKQLFDTGEPVHQSLDHLPEDAHSTYRDLAADGFTDYLALPVESAGGIFATITLGTRKRGGFSELDLENFLAIRDFVSPFLQVHSLRYLSESLLNTYVGKRTGEKVLAGMIKRGDAEVIDAALWFSDLRDFTGFSESMPPAVVLETLNTYFEQISDAVTPRGGEILRFIGDAMLIVFPIGPDFDRQSACESALSAATEAQQVIAALNGERRLQGLPQIDFGVGLNTGEVVYGNVGAPDRLDFTVMGPAVNRASRLESLTKHLGRSILFSQEFSACIDRPCSFMGMHNMKGIAEPAAVYALAESGHSGQ